MHTTYSTALMKPIVIFDDKCGPCTAFGTWGKNVIPLGYNTEPAKKLMKAQFGKDYGFALILFEGNKVYWGNEAASEATKIAYSKTLGTMFRRVIHAVYPIVIGCLNVLLRRKILPHPPKFKGKRLPATGSVPLTEKALKTLRSMQRRS